MIPVIDDGDGDDRDSGSNISFGGSNEGSSDYDDGSSKDSDKDNRGGGTSGGGGGTRARWSKDTANYLVDIDNNGYEAHYKYNE